LAYAHGAACYNDTPPTVNNDQRGYNLTRDQKFSQRTAMHTRPLRKFGEPCKMVYPIEQRDNKLSTNNVVSGYYVVRADKQNFLHPGKIPAPWNTKIPNADLVLRQHDGRLCIAGDVRLDSEIVWQRRQRVLARDLPSSTSSKSTDKQPLSDETDAQPCHRHHH